MSKDVCGGYAQHYTGFLSSTPFLKRRRMEFLFRASHTQFDLAITFCVMAVKYFHEARARARAGTGGL